LTTLIRKLREEEKEVGDRKKTKGKPRESKKRSLKVKSDAEMNAESLDVEFNVRKLLAVSCLEDVNTLSNVPPFYLQRKLKGDAERREAASKSKPSKGSKKRESSSGDKSNDNTSKATKKQRSSKTYSKVGAPKPTSNASAPATKSRPEPAIKTKDKKDSQRRKSTGSVRFDASVNKPVS